MNPQPPLNIEEFEAEVKELESQLGHIFRPYGLCMSESSQLEVFLDEEPCEWSIGELEDAKRLFEHNLDQLEKLASDNTVSGELSDGHDGIAFKIEGENNVDLSKRILEATDELETALYRLHLLKLKIQPAFQSHDWREDGF